MYEVEKEREQRYERNKAGDKEPPPPQYFKRPYQLMHKAKLTGCWSLVGSENFYFWRSV